MIEMLLERKIIPISNAPNWVLGEVGWSGEKIPLLALERLFGFELGKEQKRTRVIIVSCLLDNYQYKYLGIQTTGVPKLVQLHIDDFSIEKNTDELPKFIKLKAEFKGQPVIVPDMLEIEKNINSS